MAKLKIIKVMIEIISAIFMILFIGYVVKFSFNTISWIIFITAFMIRLIALGLLKHYQ